jgi:glycosyltransferase involved in cell wall biosynthesis
MNVAHIVTTFPPVHGGMGRVCYEQILQLMHHEINPLVYTIRFSHAENTNDMVDGIFVRRISPFIRLGAGGWIPSLFHLLRDDDIHLVHLHYPFFGMHRQIAHYCQSYHVPLIITYHMDVHADTLPKRIYIAADNVRSLPVLIKQAQALCVLSMDHYNSSSLYRYDNLIGNKLEVVPNGIDNTIFNHSCRHPVPKNISHLANKKVFLFVGNLLPFKGVDVLLHSMRNVVNQVEEAHLVIAGGGHHLEQIKNLSTKLDLKQHVTFVGAVEHKTIIDYYAHAYVVVSPSLYSESFSLVNLEALACGVPVVTSNLPGVRMLVANGKNGIVVKPGASEQLTSALISLCKEHTLYDRLKKGAASFDVVPYAWDTIGARLTQLYRRFV